MSVVIAVRAEDRIWLASDSQVSYGGTKMLIVQPHSFKLTKHPHNFHIGTVGSFRDSNIIATSSVEFLSTNAIVNNSLNFSEVVRSIVPKFFEELNNFGRIIAKENGMIFMESSFLIARGLDAYQIDRDGAVIELNDVLAIGSGADAAESAFLSMEGLAISEEEKIIRATMVACDKDLYVNYPIIYTDTLTNVLRIFDGENTYTLDKDGNLVLMSKASDEEKAPTEEVTAEMIQETEEVEDEELPTE